MHRRDRETYVSIAAILLLAALALAAIALGGCAPVIYTHGIPNFQVVDAPPERAVYRGGEPTAEGWRYLHDQLHVCYAVQLDYDWERPKGVTPPDGVSVEELSMPPADADDLFRGPSAEALATAALYVDSAMQVSICAVYVHCLHGNDRTGAVVATYRHLFQHWTKKAALEEARRLGFHVELIGLLRAWEAVP